MTPRKLSHYEIREELSRGGMGIVYRAHDVKLEREVALKILLPDLVKNEVRKRRFIQEAKAAAALKHPNIAVIYEIDKYLYFTWFEDTGDIWVMDVVYE